MIADAAHVRKLGNLPAGVLDSQLEPHLWTAEERLRSLVTDAVYEAVQTIAEGLGTPRDFSSGNYGSASAADKRKTRSLANAEAYLVLAQIFQGVNTHIETHNNSPAGVVSAGQSGEDAFNYLSPSQVDTLQQSYLAQAERAMQTYLVAPFPTPQKRHAIDVDGDIIDEEYPRNKTKGF